MIIEVGGIVVNYLEQGTGLSFELNVSPSTAATVEDMCASPDDSMGFLHSYSYVLANRLCGVDVSFKAIRYGWDVNWTEILVRRDSAIQSVEELDGLTWGITVYDSNSSYMTPMAMWNRAGITPGDIIETGDHEQAVMAVYSGDVEFATSFFSPPIKEPAWQPGDDPDVPDDLVEECAPNEWGQLWCDGYRVLDARTLISSEVPNVVQELRILEISPPVANDTISFGPDFPVDLRMEIGTALEAFAESEEWWDSIGRSDFYNWQGLSQATDAEYDFTREIVAAAAYDIDDDNIADVEDNAPTRYNPDQSDIDSDGIGDVADVCPSDPLDECNPSNSTSESVGYDGGILITPQGSVVMDIPAGALYDETSISITDTGTGFVMDTNIGKAIAVFGVEIGPAGTVFDSPVELVFSWDDVDPEDGKEDSTNAKEENLIIIKDSELITDKCKDEPADGVLPDCDMIENTFTFEVDSLSEFALVTKMADAGGPYLVQAGSSILLDGSGIDTGSLTYSWTAEEGEIDPPDVEDPYYIPGIEAGIFDLTLRVTYPDGLFDEDTTFVVVYDPEGGFVTGGGWFVSPPGACQPAILDVCENNPTGKATFGFVSKYKTGANVPTGNTEFQFNTGNLNFHSSSYDWLVINQGGFRAQYKGVGAINGEGEFKFMIWAVDDAQDTFRIKIWYEENESEIVVYDNKIDGVDEFGQPISGGNIIVHK